jgi:outer membrane lipoprotein-sorting protein
MKYFFSNLSLVVIAFFIVQNSFADEKGTALVKKADMHRGLQDSFSTVIKTIVLNGADKNEQVYTVKVRDADTCLVEQIAPARAQGRKLLMKGLDMWLFTQQVSKPVRISLQQRLTGDISNGDISRTNYANDYSATVIGTDAKNKATILELLANDKKVTYHKIKYWITTANGYPLKSEFYALNGKLMKTAVFSDFKKINGLDRMTKVTIQDALAANKKSILIYSKHKSEKFADSLFNKEQMDQ